MLRIITGFLFTIIFTLAEAETKVFKTPNSVSEMAAVEVLKNVYVIHGMRGLPNPENRGLIANIGIIVSNAGVIVVDTGSSQTHGNLILKEISKITSAPVVAVFNTHIHGDHWLGNDAIQKRFPKTKFYGYRSMVEAAQSGAGENWLKLFNDLTNGALGDTKPFPPNEPVLGNDNFIFGNVHIKTHNSGAAHTPGDIIISADLGALGTAVFLGDIGVHKQLGRMDEGSFSGNIQALDNAIALNASAYIPGHGPTTIGAKSAKIFRKYLAKLYKRTAPLYEEGLTDFEIKDKILPDFKQWHSWIGFDEAFGRHVSLVYLEIEETSF